MFYKLSTAPNAIDINGGFFPCPLRTHHIGSIAVETWEHNCETRVRFPVSISVGRARFREQRPNIRTGTARKKPSRRLGTVSTAIRRDLVLVPASSC